MIRSGIDGPGASIRFIQDLTTLTVVAGDGQASFSVPTWLGDGNDYYVELRSEVLWEIRDSDVSGPSPRIDSDCVKRRGTTII